MNGLGTNTNRRDREVTPDGWLLSEETNNLTSVSSSRINGKLKIRMNPYNRSYSKKKFTPAMVGTTSWTGEYVWRYVRPDVTTALSQREIDNCVLDFYNEVNGMATNLLDAVRQRQETVNMITSNVMKLVRSMRFLKKGKWKKAASALGVSPRGSPRGRDVPARWLELQYGWLPLLGDIYTIGNEFFPEPKFRAKKSVVTELRDDVKNVYGYGAVKLVDRYSIVGHFNIDGVALPTMQHLGVLNPLGVLWEAVPFSFVVDWFLPVGDWISSLCALTGISFREVSVIRTQRSTRSGFVYSNPYDPKRVTSDCFEDTYTYKRTLGLPERPFPSFKNPLSIGHFANGMSLLATIFGSKR